MMGQAARPVDAALCNSPVTTNTALILGVTDQSAGGQGRGGQRSIA